MSKNDFVTTTPFGDLLRAHRRRAGLSQEALAERSELSPQAISLLERGVRRRPRPETIEALVRSLALEPDDAASLRRAAARGETSLGGLPVDVAGLVGRHRLHTEALRELTTTAELAGTPRVVLLYGAAGSGKSASAIHLGHQASAWYPDGQHFTRLQRPDGAPAEPFDVLGELLRAVLPSVRNLPETVDERAALFRTQVSGRATLFVFDDATSVEQVRSLLPSGPRCGVIVTSRRPLFALEVGKHHEVVPLTSTESAELLSDLAGDRWPGAETWAAERIVHHCGGSPLALHIAGSRLAREGDLTADSFAADLDDAASRLNSLSSHRGAVRTSLELSLAGAPPESRLLYRRLALVPSDEFAAWVAAPLLDTSERLATLLMDDLLDLGLVSLSAWNPEPRYRMHSTVRAHAAQLAADEESGADEALARYLATLARLTSLADHGIGHGLLANEGLAPPEGPQLPRAEATAAGEPELWMGQEADTICTAVDLAVRYGAVEPAAILALRVNGFLAVRDDHGRRLAVLQAARSTLTDGSRPDLLARVDQFILAASSRRGVVGDDLLQLARQAQASAAAAGAVRLELSALRQRAFALSEACRFEEALADYRVGLAMVERHAELTDDRAMMLCGIGNVLNNLGRPDEGLVVLRVAADLHSGRTRTRAITLKDLLQALIDTRRLTEATGVLEEMRDILTEIDDQFGLGFVHQAEGRIAVLQGRPADARKLIRRAEEVFREHEAPQSLRRVRLVVAELAVAEDDVHEARQCLTGLVEDATAARDQVGAHLGRKMLAEISG